MTSATLYLVDVVVIFGRHVGLVYHIRLVSKRVALKS
jgi:hypothetical protein